MPAAVERLLTVDVAEEIARTFGDQIVYPQRIVVDWPAGSSPAPAGFSRRFPGFPGWPGLVLVLSDENQGVCSWGVPSGGSEVVVGGDLLDAGRATSPLRQFTAGLLDLPGLDQALWSNDEEGEPLLGEARRLSR